MIIRMLLKQKLKLGVPSVEVVVHLEQKRTNFLFDIIIVSVIFHFVIVNRDGIKF